MNHIIWECARIDRGANANEILGQVVDLESWETTLLSTDPEVQEQVVRLAEDAAGVQGILAVV